MAITKAKKEQIVQTLTDALAHAPTVVFVHFNRLPVADTNKLRRSLQQEGVGYMVAKKTLMKRVFDTMHITGEFPPLEGEIAIAYGQDPLAPARAVHAFAKSKKEQMKIVGGIFEGTYKTQAEMQAIATIPGIKELRGMFVNLINSPIQRFAIALNQIAGTK